MKKIVFFVFIIVLSTLMLVGSIFLIYNRFLKVSYVNEVNYASELTGVNKDLIFAVIKCESNFNSDIVSKKGATGLMQVMPLTAEYVKQIFEINDYNTSNDLKNPQMNIIIGSYYLKYLLSKYNDIETVLGCYNAGEGNVLSWLKNEKYSIDGIKLNSTPFKATNHYIDKVLFYVNVYQKSNIN